MKGLREMHGEKQTLVNVPLMWYSVVFVLFVFSSSSAIEKETISMFADTGLVTATAGMQTLTQKSAKQKVFCLVRTVMFQL